MDFSSEEGSPMELADCLIQFNSSAVWKQKLRLLFVSCCSAGDFLFVYLFFQIKRNDVVSLISHTEKSLLFCFVSDGASSS